MYALMRVRRAMPGGAAAMPSQHGASVAESRIIASVSRMCRRDEAGTTSVRLAKSLSRRGDAGEGSDGDDEELFRSGEE